MIGEQFQIEIEFGLGTKKIWATVIQRLQNGEYILEGDDGNRYIRKITWVNPDYLSGGK